MFFVDVNIKPIVYLGWDSRVSSVSLSQEVERCVVAVGGKCVDFGLVTTPQLHFLVHIQVGCFGALFAYILNKNL